VPNIKVNTRHNGQCSKEQLFSSSSGQIWQIGKAVNSSTLSSDCRQDQRGGKKGPSVESIAQHSISKEVFSQEMTANALFKQ
jgi:hypothetical protein